MSEDRLKEIKHYITTVYQGHIARGHFDWLISEVERFQQKDGLRTREHNILVQENRNLTATIATLREALEILVPTLRQAEKAAAFSELPGDYRMDAISIGEKALTTEQEE